MTGKEETLHGEEGEREIDSATEDIQKLEQRITLSGFDTAFLFTFTAITVCFSILSSNIGILRGLFPFVIILLSVYTYYVYIWHGMINRSISARLFAWKLLILETSTLFSALLLTLIVSLLAATSSQFYLYLDHPGLYTEVAKMAGLLLLPMMFRWPLLFLVPNKMWGGIKRAFQNSFPQAARELSTSGLREANAKYSGKGALFFSASMTIEVLAVQEWELANSLIMQPITTYSLDGFLLLIGIFLLLFFFGYFVLYLSIPLFVRNQ